MFTLIAGIVAAVATITTSVVNAVGNKKNREASLELAEKQLDGIQTQAEMEMYVAKINADMQKYLSDNQVDITNIDATKAAILAYYEAKVTESAGKTVVYAILIIMVCSMVIVAMKQKTKK